MIGPGIGGSVKVWISAGLGTLILIVDPTLKMGHVLPTLPVAKDVVDVAGTDQATGSTTIKLGNG